MTARSRATLEDPWSPYRDLNEKNEALTVQLRGGEAAPEAVSRIVLKALAARRPKARCTAAIPLTARLLCRLSPGLRDRLWAGALARAGA